MPALPGGFDRLCDSMISQVTLS